MDSSEKHLPALDGVRAFAILLVLMCHAWGFSKTPQLTLLGYDFSYIMNMGKTGVQLFFVLSGYLLYPGVKKCFENRNLKPYAVKRLLRLYPPYILSIVFALYFVPRPMTEPAKQVLFHLLFIHTWFQSTLGTICGVFWSLGPETQFYVLLPLLVLLLRKISAPMKSSWARLLVGLCLFALLQRCLVIWFFGIYPMTGGLYGANIPYYLDCFFVGMLGAEIAPWVESKKWSSTLGNKIYIYDFLFLLGFAIFSRWVYLTEIVSPHLRPYGYALNNFALALIYLTFIGFAQMTNGLIAKVCRSRLIGFIGLISYGVFLFHLTVLESAYFFRFYHFFEKRIASPEIKFIIAYSSLFALTSVLAGASYYLIERPLMNWGKKTLLYKKSVEQKV